MPLPMTSCHVVPGFATMSRTERPLRALGHDRLQRVRLGRGLDHHLAADREADAADPLAGRRRAGSGGTRRRRGCRARPATRTGSGRPRSRPRRGGRRAGRRSRARASSFARFCEHARPGNEITAAPFLDSMYQPLSRSPSLVVNSTSSYGAPRSAVGHVRASGVRDDVGDRERERATTTATTYAAPTSSRPPRVAPPEPVVASARPPQRHDRRARSARVRPESTSSPV